MLIDEYYWHLKIQDYRVQRESSLKIQEAFLCPYYICEYFGYNPLWFVMNDGLYFIIELYVPVFFHLLLGNLWFGIKLSFWAPTVLSQTCNHAASVINKHILLMLYIFYDNNMKTKTKNKLAVNRKFVDIHYERILEY